MLQALFQESFGHLDAAIPAENSANDAGVLSTLAQLINTEVFTGVDPATGQPYSTVTERGTATTILATPSKSAPTLAEIVAASQRKASVPASQVEKTLQNTETLATAIATTIFAPLAMPFDALAIKAGLVPLPQELLGPTFEQFAAASQAYQAIPNMVQSDPRRIEAIRSAVQLAMSTAIPLPGGDVTWTVPTPKENVMALKEAQALAKSVIEKMGDISCPHCKQLPCACGAFELPLDLESVTQHIEPITKQHNLELAEGAAERTFIQGVQKRAATSLNKIVEGQEIELIHIPASSLITGAILNDWKLIIPAIVASIIPNETGRRGATITIKSKPANQGGDKIVVNMAELGRGADSGTFPLNALPSWSQSTLQSALSDQPWLRKIWDRTKHGSTPEIGTLSIVNPGNTSIRQDIPLAVRFLRGTKSSTGGAGILGMAISELGGIQQLLGEITGANLAATPLTSNDVELTQVATNAAAQSLADNGMRPGVVAKKAQEILSAIFANTDSRPTLENIANTVMLERQQKKTAEAKHHFEQSKLKLALANLQNALEYEVVHASKQYIPGEKEDIYYRSVQNGRLIPLTQVRIVEQSGLVPDDWERVNLPTQVVNKAIRQTALDELKSLNPTRHLWQSILSGDIPLDGIERSTIARAMIMTSNEETDIPKPVNANKRSLSQIAADNIDLLVSLLTPTRKSK